MGLSYQFSTPTRTTTPTTEEEDLAYDHGSNNEAATMLPSAESAGETGWFDAMVGGTSNVAASALTAWNTAWQAPSPVAVTGTPDWYEARHADFATRYADQGLAPPTYYLEYGGKYCKAFTQDLRPDLSAEGQAWCDATALALQQALEVPRAASPLEYDCLEKDDAAFTKFAFDSHPDAYLQSGLSTLPAQDLALISTTPEVADLVAPGGLAQVVAVGARILPMWAEQAGVVDADTAAAIDALLVTAHPTLESVVAVAYEIAAYGVTPFVEWADAWFGEGTVLALLEEARLLARDTLSDRAEPAAAFLTLFGEAP